jgi:pentose-5-phosphate-3-epimerase
MVTDPATQFDDFAEASGSLHVHVELGDPRPLFDDLRTGIGVGLSLNPPTPVESVLPYLGESTCCS